MGEEFLEEEENLREGGGDWLHQVFYSFMGPAIFLEGSITL
jgi:hypothetical protein